MNKSTLLFLLCLTVYVSCDVEISVLGYENNKIKKLKVCVIGAGPSGIGVARFLGNNQNRFDITVFEKSHDLGGQWLYTDKTDFDNYGYPVYSSIYKYLRINNPKEVNIYPDWPEINAPNVSFVSHGVILDYLKNYTDRFVLRPFMKFNTIVTNVKLEKTIYSENWKVTVKNVQSGVTEEFMFDAVIVCTGRHTKPSIPIIPGLENFRGQVLHSHTYRDPHDFLNKSVILLGAGSSGTDIGQDLLKVSQKVYLSHNHEKLGLTGIIQVPGIVEFKDDKFLLKDNSSISADVLMFCTGYQYFYPFLDDSTGITVDNNYVSPLYKHMINVLHPTMSFVGIPSGSASPFMFISQEAQYVVSVLKGKVKLPSTAEMLEDSKLKTDIKKYAHKINVWSYLDELAELGGFSSVPKYFRMATDISKVYYKYNMDHWRNYKLEIGQDKKSIKIVWD